MLTDQDIEKLKSILVTKEDLVHFATKTDIQELKEDIAGLRELTQALYVSVDGLVKSIGELTAEYRAINVQLSRHDAWIKQIAEKIGLQLSTE